MRSAPLKHGQDFVAESVNSNAQRRYFPGFIWEEGHQEPKRAHHVLPDL